MKKCRVSTHTHTRDFRPVSSGEHSMDKDQCQFCQSLNTAIQNGAPVLGWYDDLEAVHIISYIAFLSDLSDFFCACLEERRFIFQRAIGASGRKVPTYPDTVDFF